MKVWDLTDSKLSIAVLPVDGPKEPSIFPYAPMVSSVALNTIGTAVAIATATGIQVRATNGNGPHLDLPRNNGYVDVSYSPDGTLLTACSSDGELNVWRLPQKSGSPTPVLHLIQKPGWERVIFSPDGSLVAVVDRNNAVSVFFVKNGVRRLSMRHDSSIRDLAFSGNQRYLATATRDGFVHIWELATGQQISQINQRGFVQTISFAEGDKYLIAADGYTVRGPAEHAVYSRNYLRRWLWKPRDLIDAACRRVSRNLSSSEWDFFVGDGLCRAVCPNAPSACSTQ